MKKQLSFKRLRRIAFAVILVFVAAAYTVYRLSGQMPGPETVEIDVGPETTVTDTVTSVTAGVVGPKDSLAEFDSAGHIPVYLTGAVRLPGLYWVPSDSILDDIVAAAGGFSEQAAAASINLAMRAVAHQWFHIPTVEEVEQDPAAASVVQAYPGAPPEPLDLNTATASELETLPGIGPATAAAIIRYREANGAFSSVEDVMKITGIKRSRFEAIESYITVR